jgi:hypothetical protein
MKLGVVVAGLALGAGLIADGQAQNFLTNGLVAYYPFTGDAKDLSGNGNHGVVSGASLSQDMFGAFDSAYAFDGLNSVITVPDFPQAENGAHTISLWIYANEWPDGIGLRQETAVLSMDNSNPALRQWVLQGTETGELRSVAFGEGGDICMFRSIQRLQPKRWYHVVQLWDGSFFSILIDGKLERSVPGGFKPVPAANPMIIGGDPSLNQYFSGTIDNVRFYDRSLHPLEVRQLYDYESQSHTCSPRRATATANVVNGFLVGINLVDGGCGYGQNPPPGVRIKDSTGSGAVATAVVTGGVIERIVVDNPGKGYSSVARVMISPPGFTPLMEIKVTKVRVTLLVVFGKKYLLEGSNDFVSWTPVGDAFVAEDDTVGFDLDVAQTGRFFRAREVR